MALTQRFPAKDKETVTILRRSSYQRNDVETVAEGVVCILVPRTDAAQRRDAVDVRSGVALYQLEWTALLEKPNPDIARGDFLKRSDGSELRVEAVVPLGNEMQLILKEQGVA